MKDKFKKFGGHQIDDVGAYLREYLAKYPQTSVYVGTDSSYKNAKAVYASVIALYDEIRKDGVHYVFKKETEIGKIDLFSRMWKETEKSVEVAEYLEIELEGHIKRYDIEEIMVLKNPAGGYYKIHQNKLCGIDTDINPLKEHDSSIAYEAVKGFLVGLGYRARFKGEGSFAANSAADTCCKPPKSSKKYYKLRKKKKV